MDQIVRAIKPITNIALESSLRKLESFSLKRLYFLLIYLYNELMGWNIYTYYTAENAIMDEEK